MSKTTKSRFNKCITQVATAHEAKLIEDKDVEVILKNLTRNVKKHVGDTDAIDRLIQKKVAEDLIEHNRRMVSIANQIDKVKTKIDKLSARIDETGDAHRVVQGELTGNSFFRDSVALKIRVAINMAMQDMDRALKSTGAVDDLMSGKLDEELSEAIFAMDRKEGYDITKKDTPATFMAKYYKMTNDRLTAKLAKLGLFIDEIEGYIRQSTDARLLLKYAKEYKQRTGDTRSLMDISYELWRKDIDDKIDWEKMDEIYDEDYFLDKTPERKKMLNSFLKKISGNREKTLTTEELLAVANKGKKGTPYTIDEVFSAILSREDNVLITNLESLANSNRKTKISVDKLFENIDQELPSAMGSEDLLREMHRGIYTGVHGEVSDHISQNAFSVGSHGKYGMPKMTERKRKIFFKKDGKVYTDYAHKYSGKSVPKVFAEVIEEKLRLITLAQEFGPNYKAGYERVMNTLFDKLSRGTDEDRAQLAKIKDKNIVGFGIENYWKEVTGEAQMVVSQSGAFWGKAIRGWQTVTHLGMGFLSQQLDRPIFNSILQENGVSTLKSITANLSGYVRRNLDDPDTRASVEALGAGLSTLHGGMVGRLFGDARQKLGSGLEFFMKWSGMKFHDESMRYTAAGTLMGELGSRRNQSFDTLPDSLKRIFKTYDITSRDWDIARKYAMELPKEADMPVFILAPDKIADENIRMKFAEYYTGEVETAVLTPTDRESAILRAGTAEGSLMNNIIKSAGQFKSFPLAMMNNIIERQYAKHGSTTMFSLSPEAMKGHLSMINLAAQMTVAGMLVTQVREILKGREPKPFDEKFIFESFVRGGGAAIMGDVLLTEYDRHYRHPLTQLVGPSLGDISELAILTSEAVRGDLRTGAVRRFARQNMPIVNLFYIRPILDTLFLYSFEAMIEGDGHFERTDRILKQQTRAGFSKTNPISPYKRVKTFE